MLITENRLKQIIREEIQIRIIEKIIDEEIDKFLMESDAYKQYKAQDRKDIKKKVAKTLAGLAPLAAIGAVGYDAVDDYSQAARQKAQSSAQKNYETSSTIDNAAKELEKRAGNLKSWMWASTDTQTLPFPTNPENNSEAVLPPEWSVMAQVAIDMKAQKPKYAVDKNYLQVANNPDSLSSAYKGIEGRSSKGPHKDFFKTFSPDTYPFSDASDLGVHAAMFPAGTGVPSAMFDLDGDRIPDRQNIVYIPFDEIPDDYVMPLSGLTKDKLYKKYYYGNGMSLEMFNNLKGDAEPDPDTELNPELIQKTKERAQQNIKKLQQRRDMKENKITWQNYKNRKKKLA